MDQNGDLGQHRTVDLDRGIYLIQYKDADDTAAPPKVIVSSSADQRGVELVLHPDSEQAVLWEPGSTLVVRTAAEARLEISVVPQFPNGSRAASVEVKSIRQGTPPRHLDQSTPRNVLDGFELLAHVAGIGDVVVGSNDWVAGPLAPSRIEGISIQWPNRPRDVDFRYAVKIPSQAANPAMMHLKTFAGTRGRAQPLTGLVLELSGIQASNWQIVAEALFLSSPILRAVGQKVVLSGPTGREPLVGLRISVEGTGAVETTENRPAPTEPLRKSPSSGRVRVFRSSNHVAATDPPKTSNSVSRV